MSPEQEDALREWVAAATEAINDLLADTTSDSSNHLHLSSVWSLQERLANLNRIINP